MLSRRTTSKLLASAGVLAAVGVGGSALAAGGPADTPAAVPAASPLAAPPVVGAVQPDQAAAFRVLRRPRRASDVMPTAVAERTAGPSRFGRNPNLSRAVETANGTGWVVPGRGVVCLIAPDAVDGYAVTCNSTEAVADDGLTLQQVAPDESTSTSLLPDGARVVVSQDDATADAVQPDASGVAVTDTTDAERVTVVTDEGRSTVPVPEGDGTVDPTG